MATDDDLNAIADALRKISESLDYIIGERLDRFTLSYIFDYIEDVYPFHFSEIKTFLNNGLNNAKKILSNIIDKLVKKEIDNETRKSLYESGSSKEHLEFESGVLGWLMDNLKKINNWGPKDIVKKLIDKIFKAINIIIDSLKPSFPPLEVVKELKEHAENLIID
jgi:hypothetical protein